MFKSKANAGNETKIMKAALFLSFLCIWCVNYSQGNETGLKVVPHNIAVQSGETVTLQCKHYPEDLAADVELKWFLPDGTVPISELIVNQSVINMTQDKLLRYQSSNGTLTIVNVTKIDAGTYSCRKSDTMEVKSIVKVYEMPTYTTEIIVVLVINAVLVVIFITCAVWNFIKERKETNILRRRKKLGHREIAARALKD